MGALSSKSKEVRCGKCEKWQSAKYGLALAELAKPDGEEKHCYRCQHQQAWDEHLVSCATCKDGLVHSTDYAKRGLALPYASGCFKWDPGEERDEPLEGMDGLKAPSRLNKKGGGSYDTRAKPGTAGLTLFCEYGRRRTEVVRGCGSLHCPTWEPEEGARVDCVRMVAEATQQDLRYLLEARNDMSIFFHKWDCSLHGKLSAIFVEGETVQVEREPYRVHDIGEFGELGESLGGELLLRLHADEADDFGEGGPSADAVCALLQRLGAPPAVGSFSCVVPPEPLVSATARAGLMALLERSFEGRSDFKMRLSACELETLVGPAALAQLTNTLGRRIAKIWLRRCEARGDGTRLLGIPFHLDVGATTTLQVPLNGDSEYSGGRLVFAARDGRLCVPPRPAGSYTLHGNAVVHGVSPLRAGVRYSLFLLA
jgi:hypothetical protein